MINVGGGAGETLAADLTLVGARWNVGVGLTRGDALGARKGNPAPHSCIRSTPSILAQDTSGDLVALDGLEQGLEVAFAEAFVTLALYELEEDRADHGVGEDLKQ